MDGAQFSFSRLVNSASNRGTTTSGNNKPSADAAPSAAPASSSSTHNTVAPSPPPPAVAMPDSAELLQVLTQEIDILIRQANNTSDVLGRNAALFFAHAAKYVEESATATADHSDILLQSSSFFEFQVNAALTGAMQMLTAMKSLQDDLNLAKGLSMDVEVAQRSLKKLEDVIGKMEAERGCHRCRSQTWK